MASKMVHYWPLCEMCGKPGYAGAEEGGPLVPVACGHWHCYSKDHGASTTYARKGELKIDPPYAPCCSTGTHIGDEDERRFPPDF